jgi:hypothetical protein
MYNIYGFYKQNKPFADGEYKLKQYAQKTKQHLKI